MNTHLRFILLLFAILSLASCKESEKDTVLRLVKEWDGREIKFPARSVFTIQGKDTVDFDFMDAEYKVVIYVDSIGCTSCKLQLERWTEFMAEVDSVVKDVVPFIFVFHPKDVKELRHTLRLHGFNHPVSFDEKDEFNQLNRFPNDMTFQTFLLDKDNKVKVIGNPVHNPKVKELYMENMTGRQRTPDTGTTEMSVGRTEYDFGTFPMDARQECTFRLTNTGSTLLVVQDVVTSCGCTKVEYDKRPVSPGQTMELKVVYEAEESGHFSKTLKVYANTEHSPVLLRITGTAG